MFFNDLSTDVVFDRFGDGRAIAFEALQSVGDRFRNTGFYNEIEQANVVERRNLSRFRGIDVCVDEMSHIGLVGFQVESLTACHTNNLSKLEVFIDLAFDLCYA